MRKIKLVETFQSVHARFNRVSPFVIEIATTGVSTTFAESAEAVSGPCVVVQPRGSVWTP